MALPNKKVAEIVFPVVLDLAASVGELNKMNRKVRTAMWSAVQATILSKTHPENEAGASVF